MTNCRRASNSLFVLCFTHSPLFMWAAGAALYGSTVAGTYLWLKKTPPSESHATNTATPSATTWSSLAPAYDAAIGLDEAVMGVNLLRRWHVGRHARGRVLEVCAGTARNLPYYDRGRVASLTLADACPEMVAAATAKVEAAGGDLPPTTVVVASVESVAAATHYQPFDTIVDTFGLCSVPDPVAALRTMAALLAPGGSIILIEHGRTNRWGWLDAQLDAAAPAPRSEMGVRVESRHTGGGAGGGAPGGQCGEVALWHDNGGARESAAVTEKNGPVFSFLCFQIAPL